MNWGDAATWVSASVAVVAALVAVAAWRAAARAAKAAERSAAVDEQTLHSQRTPAFTAVIEEVNGGGWHRLALRLNGPADLDDVVLEPLGGKVAFTRDQYGVEVSDEVHPRRAWVYSPDGARSRLRLGDTAKWRIVPVDRYVEEDEISLRIEGEAAGAAWQVLVSVEVPKSMKESPRFYSF
ncbi:hypothetical protein ACWD5Z_27990 [Micromonospora chokoriensis]